MPLNRGEVGCEPFPLGGQPLALGRDATRPRFRVEEKRFDGVEDGGLQPRLFDAEVHATRVAPGTTVRALAAVVGPLLVRAVAADPAPATHRAKDAAAQQVL